MLTYAQLMTLHRSLRGERVLSVYIDGSATDPAGLRSWRVQLEHSLADIRKWLDGSPHDEREQFERAARRLNDALADFSGGIGAPGWAAFITANGMHEGHRLPAPAPTLAVWSTGACVAPYMRALKESRPVVVVVADARKASIYTYRLGELERVDVVRAYHVVDRAEHMGSLPRAGFHTGTRGTAGRDSAQRSLLKGRDRMIAETADRVEALAGSDGWILVGGTKRVVPKLAPMLSAIAPGRTLELDSFDVHSTEAQITEVARSGASVLRDTHDQRRLAAIEELAGAHGAGAVGPADVQRALEQSSVRELYLAHRFLEDHAAEAEQAVRAALDQDAAVEEVSGRAADWLLQHGGLAAALRFRPVALETAIAQ